MSAGGWLLVTFVMFVIFYLFFNRVLEPLQSVIGNSGEGNGKFAGK
jgi:hypothetical protein